MTVRRLEPLAVPADASVVDLLPALGASLSGERDALLLHAAETPPPAHLAPGEPLAPEEDDDADPTAFAVLTSGSTGAAKGTLLPASALLASVSATHDRLGGPGTWLLALPADHVAGLQVLLRSLVARTTPVALDLTRSFTADAFVAGTARLERALRAYTSLVPTQLVRLLDAGEEAVAALRRYDAVLLGGAATAPALRQRARDAGVKVVTTYGMSETCGGCVYDGVPLDGVELALGEGDAIRLGGPVVARGYRGLGAPGFGTERGVRWFTTADAGRVADGVLTVTGRRDDGILTGGLTVAPGEVEAALAGVEGVAEAVVVGVADEEWGHVVAAAVVLRDPLDEATLRARVRDAVVAAGLGREAVPRRLTVLERLPLRGPGKPDRAAVHRILAPAPGET